MCQLLSRQLDLAQRLASQLNDARERRERLLGLLKTLWLQLAELRAGSARQWLATDEISGKIRAVCEDIERHVAALEETARVLKGAE
jgi:phage baseplate assembly protein gpV